MVVVAPTLFVVGMSQPTKTSAEAEHEIPIPIAQNKDTYLKKFLANFLLIVILLVTLKFQHGYTQ